MIETGKTIAQLEAEVKALMEGETRREAFFRAMLTLSQFGDVAKYITHDRELNPKARPHGSREDEVLAVGQLLMMALSVAVARGIDCTEAIEAGRKNWQERDWQRREGTSQGPIRGRVAVVGQAEGIAYVVAEGRTLEGFRGGILVTPFIRADQTQYLQTTGVQALVTDNGGVMSHPAIIAREMGIVAVVGTGNGTMRIPHGAKIIVDATKDPGEIKIEIQASES